MVAGGSRRGVEASSSHAAAPDLGEERVDDPLAFADAKRSRSCGRSSTITAPRSTER
jgi:hypothetical protein